WNAADMSTAEDRQEYLKQRTREKFSAVQSAASQWRAATKGDLEHRLAYRGSANRIEINPAFLQALDKKADALNNAGLLNVPVLLWAYASGSDPKINPGVSLPD